MLIHIHTKNEPIRPCDVLIIKENAMVQVPATDLKALLQAPPDIRIVKAKENMMLKCGILVSGILSEFDKDAVGSAVQVFCADKPILDAVCSLDYPLADKNEAKCVPAKADAKPAAPKPKASRDAKPSRAQKPSKPAQAEPAGKPSGESDDGGVPAKDPGPDTKTDTGPHSKPDAKPNDDTERTGAAAGGAETAETPVVDANAGTDAKPADDSPIGPVKGNEVDLSGPPEDKPRPKPGENPAAKVLKLLKDVGVPSSQLPGVLEAIRDSVDPEITLPMQIRTKTMKDGAAGDLDPAETAKRVAPVFAEAKRLMEEARNA